MAEGVPAVEQADMVVAPASAVVDARKQALARTLETKEQLGYRIESRSAAQAVLVTSGRRRLFGLRPSLAGSRQLVSVDENGAVTVRKISEEL